MRALTFLPAAVLLTAALGAPAEPARAAETCLGKPVTIAATTGTVEGTPGDDVIEVSGTNTKVLAGDGNDAICLVGGAGVLSVDAGAGNDTVDTTLATVPSDTVLGAGADTFVGGAQIDTVRSSGDPAPDAIATGAGRDAVTVYGAGAVTVDLGPDDDILSFNATVGAPGSSLDLGDGKDLLLEDQVDLSADLAQGTLVQNGVVSKLVGAEVLQASGHDVTLRGDNGDNEFRVIGCRVTLYGAGGRDYLGHIGKPTTVPCAKVKAKLYGQGGPDTLVGSSGRDTLVGGRGKDHANGGGGRDKCRAEKERRCER